MTKKKKPQRKGLLGRPLPLSKNDSLKELARVMADIEGVDEATGKRIDLELKKLDMLLDEYDISRDGNEWMMLAWKLAEEYEPGFQLQKKRGRPKKWTDDRLSLLLVEFDDLIDLKHISKGASWASKRIAKKEPWKSFIETKLISGLDDENPDPSLALLKIYHDAKSNPPKKFGLWKARHERYIKEKWLEEWQDLVNITVN